MGPIAVIVLIGVGFEVARLKIMVQHRHDMVQHRHDIVAGDTPDAQHSNTDRPPQAQSTAVVVEDESDAASEPGTPAAPAAPDASVAPALSVEGANSGDGGGISSVMMCCAEPPVDSEPTSDGLEPLPLPAPPPSAAEMDGQAGGRTDRGVDERLFDYLFFCNAPGDDPEVPPPAPPLAGGPASAASTTSEPRRRRKSMSREMSRGDILEQFHVDRMDEAPPEAPSAADQIGGLKDLCAIAIFAVTYLAFPSTSLVIFRTFDQDENISDAPGEEDLSYLKADMSIDCTTGDYEWWSYYATVMVFVYPLGIPLLYLVLCAHQRHRINPDPLAVLAEIVRNDAVGPRQRNAQVEVTDEMRLLASNTLKVRQRQKELREVAVRLHAPLLAAQDAKDAADDLVFEEERAAAEAVGTAAPASGTKMAKTTTRKGSKDSLAIRTARKGLRTVRRADGGDPTARVPARWQEFLPGHARAVCDLEGAATLVEMSMVVAYRDQDPHVKHLTFLFESCEWRWMRGSQCLYQTACRSFLTRRLLVAVDRRTPLLVLGDGRVPAAARAHRPAHLRQTGGRLVPDRGRLADIDGRAHPLRRRLAVPRRRGGQARNVRAAHDVPHALLCDPARGRGAFGGAGPRRHNHERDGRAEPTSLRLQYVLRARRRRNARASRRPDGQRAASARLRRRPANEPKREAGRTRRSHGDDGRAARNVRQRARGAYCLAARGGRLAAAPRDYGGGHLTSAPPPPPESLPEGDNAFPFCVFVATHRRPPGEPHGLSPRSRPPPLHACVSCPQRGGHFSHARVKRPSFQTTGTCGALL